MPLVRAVALLLTAITGFSGLVYEVTWQKYLATLVGSHAEAAAAVLGIFLAGLAIGYGMFGSWTERRVARAAAAGAPPRLLALYGAVEIGIGLWAFAFPALFASIEALSIALPIANPSLRFAIDVLFTTALIGPPAVMMGATVPFLTQALPRGVAEASRWHAWIYAMNTAGGCFGALAAAFWLVPAYGLTRVLVLVGTLNVLAGLVFVGLDVRVRALRSREASGSVRAPVAKARRAPVGDRRLQALIFAALLSGFAMMTLQTVVLRLAGLSFGASPFAFASVVAVFVLCIAVGSLAVAWAPRIDRRALVISQAALVVAWLLLYRPIQQAPYWAYRLRALFPSEPEAFLPYWLTTVAVMAIVLAPAIALSGAMLPLLFDRLRDDPDRLGQLSGRLYRWNTLGSLLGALLGGHALLHWLDLDGVYRVAVAALVAMVGLLRFGVGEGTGTRVGDRRWLGAAGAALLLIAVLPPWDRERLSVGYFRDRSAHGAPIGPLEYVRQVAGRSATRFYDDDPVQSVAVREYDAGGGRSASLMNNGKSDGSTLHDELTMKLAGLLPALLAERVEQAYVIGLGTGMTAATLADLGPVERVRVSEISPAVIAALPFFDFATGGASTDPRIEIIESDAYRQLSRETTRYDVVVSEPSNPWVAGVEMLYTVEFLEAVRARIRPGGVYVQWFHRYETSDEAVATVLRTFDTVFDASAVWFALESDLLLVGFVEPVPTPEDLLGRILARMEAPQVASALASLGIDRLPDLLAHELLPIGVLHAGMGPGPLHRLRHPILSDQAGRGFFVGEEGVLPYFGIGEARRLGEAHSLVRAYARHLGADRLPDDERLALIERACRVERWGCNARIAEWQARAPGSPALAAWLDDRRRERASAPAESIAGTAPPGTEALPAATHFYREDIAEALTGLFSLQDADAVVSAGEALSALALARLTYQPSLPFDPAALESIWAACADCGPYRANLDRFLREGKAGIRLRATPAGSTRPANH